MQNNKYKREFVFFVISIALHYSLVNLSIKLSSVINKPNSINALTGIVFFDRNNSLSEKEKASVILWYQQSKRTRI